MRTLLVGLVLLALGVAAVVAYRAYDSPLPTLEVVGFILMAACLVAVLRAWEKGRRKQS